MIDPEVLAQDAEDCRPVVTDEALRNIAQLALEQRFLEKVIAETEAKLGKLEKELAKLAEITLPEAMAAVGMTEFTLGDGFSVKVSQEYYAAIPSADTDKPELIARREAAFAWLRENKHGDLIKSQIVVESGRGQEKEAALVVRVLDTAGISYSNNETVHWQTLRAFVKEQLKSGQPVPEQLFGVHVKRVASVKPARG